MNREILFRGKRADNGEWVQGDLLQNIDCVKIREKEKDIKHIARSFEVIPETVGQFTGLYDGSKWEELTEKEQSDWLKNHTAAEWKGKKIFERDYVVCEQYIGGNFIDYHTEIGFVEMKHGAFGLHRKQGYYRPFKDWLEDYEYEIIGNIHDNPELLEVHK